VGSANWAAKSRTCAGTSGALTISPPYGLYIRKVNLSSPQPERNIILLAYTRKDKII